MTAPILALEARPTNGVLIADVARLGYLRPEWVTCDPTFGLGLFWTDFQPDVLIPSDGDRTKDPLGRSIDFRRLPWRDRSFDAFVFDPPYKLNGTPSDVNPMDWRYGVHVARTWQNRHRDIRLGIDEAGRTLKRGGMFLLKCQSQVCSGAVRWQTDEFTAHTLGLGFRKVDEFIFPSYRAQPEGRRQVHARRNYSTLLVFKKETR